MYFNGKVLRENGFMSREKLLLLQIIAALKELGTDERVINEMKRRIKLDKTEMLNGIVEELTVARRSYSVDTHGYEVISGLIAECEGNGDNIA